MIHHLFYIARAMKTCLVWTSNLTDPAAWAIVESHRNKVGTGLPHVYIRDDPQNGEMFRLRVHTRPARISDWEK